MKVGDYVRTNDRGIRKVGEIIDNLFYRDEEGNLHQKGNLLKSSPNIIDLIQYGDYVNGVMVNEIKDGKPFKEDYNDPYYSYYFDDIYSIITKEQFEAMKYEIK